MQPFPVSSHQPVVEPVQVLGQVVDFQFVLVSLLAGGFHLMFHFPQLLLENYRGPACLALLKMALDSVELLLQDAVLMLKGAHGVDVDGEAGVELLQLGFLFAARDEELLVVCLGLLEVQVDVASVVGPRAAHRVVGNGHGKVVRVSKCSAWNRMRFESESG